MTREADHGQRSTFARTGGEDDHALAVDERARLAAIRADLETPGGMVGALRDKAASLGLIVEWGQAWLAEKALKEGGAVAFESPMLKQWFTAFESYRRSIETLYKMTTRREGGLSAADVLTATNGWQQTQMEFPNDDSEVESNE